MRTKIDKNQVISEMIKTEITYNDALTLMEQALSHEDIIGSSSFLQALKAPVSELKLISDLLLINGTKGIELEITDEQHTALRIQRTQLLSRFFLTYKIYAQLFNSYVTEFQSNPDQFKNIDAYLREHTPNNLNFESHLIMPVQRGPRYSMLVAAAKANTKHLHPENLDEFNELELQFRELLKSINSKIDSPSTNDRYWFGKYTCEFLFGKSTPVASSSTSPETSQPYRFGDISRGLFGIVKTTFFSPSHTPDTITISEPSSSMPADIVNEFHLFDSDSSDDESIKPY